MPTDLRWHRLDPADPAERADRAQRTDHADRVLRAHVQAALRDAGHAVDADAVRLGRSCPACGSADHGRPWAALPDGERPVWVSLSRAGEHLVTAVSTVGPIGVDVEVRADVERRWVPSLVLADGESVDSPDERAWWWTAKEAVLKRRGTGLSTPMTAVRLDAERRLAPIEAPPGFVAALADPLVGRDPA